MNSFKLISLSAVVAALIFSLSTASARTWTSADESQTFEGELLSYDAETEMVGVTLANGKQMVFSQDKLSASDIAYLKEQGNVTPPPPPASALLNKPYNARGDRLPDFSMCGYMGGGVEIPALPVKITLTPRGDEGDDTERIQEAIDKVSVLPKDNNGHRGAILLKKGRYRVENPLFIKADGVVLRGEGQFADGTVLFCASKEKITVIQLQGKTNLSVDEKTRREVINDYVPIGAISFQVDEASVFRPGDAVRLTRQGTKEWLAFLRMDRLTEDYNNQKLKNWTPEGYTFHYDRTVAKVDGNRITLDAPVVEPLDKKYGGGYIEKVSNDARIQQCGVEQLRIESDFDRDKQGDNHAKGGVSLSGSKNCWVRNVTVAHVAHSAVAVQAHSKWITVQDCAMIDPVGPTRGGTKYSFINGGELSLFQRLYSRNARHDYSLTPRKGGPNVFLHCFSDHSISVSESHHRYGHGALFDSCIIRGTGGHTFLAVNRGNSGSGHGWAGALMVFWNCGADDGGYTIVMKPPTSQNFSIGWSGTAKNHRAEGHDRWILKRSKKKFDFNGLPVIGDGYILSPTKPVTPHSLYLQQLRNRLGETAVKNITADWQLKPVDLHFMPSIANEPVCK